MGSFSLVAGRAGGETDNSDGTIQQTRHVLRTWPASQPASQEGRVVGKAFDRVRVWGTAEPPALEG